MGSIGAGYDEIFAAPSAIRCWKMRSKFVVTSRTAPRLSRESSSSAAWVLVAPSSLRSGLSASGKAARTAVAGRDSGAQEGQELHQNVPPYRSIASSSTNCVPSASYRSSSKTLEARQARWVRNSRSAKKYHNTPLFVSLQKRLGDIRSMLNELHCPIRALCSSFRLPGVLYVDFAIRYFVSQQEWRLRC